MQRIFFDEMRSNKRKSWALLFGFLVVFGAVGAIAGLLWFGMDPMGAGVGVFFALVVAGLYALIGMATGDKWILKMTGAHPVTKQEYPHLYHTVEGLAIAAGIPTPKAYVIEDSALNAFATGKDPEHASITVTTGLLKKLNRQELEGVVAHEMSHIKNYDVRFMMLVTILIGALTLISDFLLRSFLWGGMRNRDSKGGQAQIILIVVGLLLAILSPLIGQLIRMAISRKREYLADANGAALTRYPEGLAGALEKIKADPDPLVDKANKATAHLFISTPFRKKAGFVSKMFATHPPIDDRITRLREM